MGIKSLSLVNQKLAHTRVLLRIAQGLPGNGGSGSRLQFSALIDGAMFHLICGYRHYLHEIAETYQVKSVANISTNQDLDEALAVLGKSPSEADELRTLLASDSWLVQLQSCYSRLWLMPEATGQSFSALDDGLIKVVSLDAGNNAWESPTLADVINWEKAFNDLVNRHRETSSEY